MRKLTNPEKKIAVYNLISKIIKSKKHPIRHDNSNYGNNGPKN